VAARARRRSRSVEKKINDHFCLPPKVVTVGADLLRRKRGADLSIQLCAIADCLPTSSIVNKVDLVGVPLDGNRDDTLSSNGHVDDDHLVASHVSLSSC
jgi:hypothetical protein